MSDRTKSLTRNVLDWLEPRHRGETAFVDAVEEIADDVLTIEKANSEFTAARAFERLVEADRIISFRVVWRDDKGSVQINRGWRVQHSNLLGPYKGGLRWSPGADRAIFKSLAFEQTYKNALTGLPLGGAKGGSDFNPEGRSQAEIERFAIAFMAELTPHIGPHRDVPAGDMGVGERELGILFRAHGLFAGHWGGALTGKPYCLGGSALRPEATGYGLIYFLCEMLGAAGKDIEGRRIAISGRGNVATHAAGKVLEIGGRVISLSGRAGTWHAPDGMTPEALDWLRGSKAAANVEPPASTGLEFLPGEMPWTLEPEIALPCATQNEIDANSAKALVEGGCRFLAEGANMPVTADARRILDRGGVVQAPGKAANAGGVAVSCLEMRQNAAFVQWTSQRVDTELRRIMRDIHARIVDEAPRGDGRVPDYRRGANIAAYRRLARAVVEAGAV